LFAFAAIYMDLGTRQSFGSRLISTVSALKHLIYEQNCVIVKLVQKND